MLKNRKNIIILSTGEEIPKTLLERGFVKSVETKAMPELVSRETAWKQVAAGDVARDTEIYVGSAFTTQRKVPIGLTKLEFENLKKTIIRELDSLSVQYNPSQIKVVGSSVVGYSSQYTRTPGRQFVRDVVVVMTQKQYNDIVNKIRIIMHPGSKELKSFEKEVAKGKLGKYWLNKISPDHQFSTRLHDYAEALGVKKVDVSVIREKSAFDEVINIPFSNLILYLIKRISIFFIISF